MVAKLKNVTAHFTDIGLQSSTAISQGSVGPHQGPGETASGSITRSIDSHFSCYVYVLHQHEHVFVLATKMCLVHV